MNKPEQETTTSELIIESIMFVGFMIFMFALFFLDIHVQWADQTPLTFERAEELNQMCNNKCIDKGFEQGGEIDRVWMPFGSYLKNNCECFDTCKGYPNSKGEREEYKCRISKNKIELFEEAEEKE